MNKLAVKVRVEYLIHSMVRESVSNRCFVNIARFWIIDFEKLVRSMAIRLLSQVVMQCEDVIHEVHSKLNNVLPFPFIT